MQPSTETSYLLEHVPSVLHRQSDQILQERLGIGISQFKILAIAEWQPGVTQRELADRLGQTEASISRQVGVLVRKNLLATHVDPAERRRHLVAPTSKGAKITHAAQEVLAAFYDPLLSQLSERERSQFHTILTKLHDYCCSPGKRMACNQPTDIEAIYANQQLTAKN